MSPPALGTFEDLIEMTPEAMRPVARRLRTIIKEVDSDFVEVVRLGDRAATFGIGPKKMSEGYVYIMPHQQWVNLGFYRGTALADPTGLLEGTGAKMRHIKVRSVTEAKRPAVRKLITAAVAERRRGV